MVSLRSVVARPACWVIRRGEFPGKRRLRNHFPLPGEGDYEVRLPGGPRMRLDMSEWTQQNYFYGLYDAFELSLVKRLLRGGGDFVDVGAHVGLYAISAALAIDPDRTVLAFEPNPASRARMLENISLNGCTNVHISGNGVSDTSGSGRLSLPLEGDAAWSALETETRFGKSSHVEVQLTTLDLALRELGLKPGVVKIDVEGHELRVLAGMQETLQHRPAVLCEVGHGTAPDIARKLTGLGYLAFRVGKDALGSPEWPTEGICNALFVTEAQKARLVGS